MGRTDEGRCDDGFDGDTRHVGERRKSGGRRKVETLLPL